MVVLVTGGAGYIGSHTIVELLNSGKKVLVVDNLTNSSLEALKRVEEITEKKISFFKIDLLDKVELEKVFNKFDITSVMHFAGVKSVNESVGNPMYYYQNNVVGTMNLIELMEKYGVRKLIFSSSATVYGNSMKMPVDEKVSPSVLNPYGRTKLIIENFLEDLFNSNNNWRIAILRYFNPVGAHKSGKIGENPSGSPNNLMPYISQVAIGKQKHLSVFGDNYNTPDGTGVRDYIHVMDVANGHLKALEYVNNNKGIDTFNLGSGKGYSVLDLIKCFEEVSEKIIDYKYAARRPGDVGVCYANPSKALELLNWETKYDLKTICQDTWKWQKNNPKGY